MQFEQLGPYQVVRKLGRGGMGVVYEGIDEEIGQRAAVKVLSAPMAEEEGFRSRFEAEIETLRKLKHPNIVRLFGFGQQQGHLFYAMELVEGSSLETDLRNGKKFDWRETARIAINVCAGLRHAHDRGVIHRDIKPANLLVGADGTVKLSDFGIARLFGQAPLTSAGSVVGTVEYMAPEQAEARPVDQRADLYSLGGVMYALLTGRAPFRAKSFAEMVEKQRTCVPELVRRYAPDVPAALERTIAELLEKNPAKRIANAMLLARRLESMLLAADREDLQERGDEQDEGQTADGSSVHTAPSGAADALPPTRAMDDEDDIPAEGSGVQTTPPPSASRLPETRSMSSVDRPAPEAGQPASEQHDVEKTEGPTVTDVAAPRRPPSHFTPVAAEELDRQFDEDGRPALISPQTWILAIALVAVGLGVWYLLQPPTADKLFEKIMARTRSGSIESLRAAEDDIAEFLTRFSSDTRAHELRLLEGEIELDRLERRFELRASGRLNVGTPLSACETAYLEAISHLRVAPEHGIVKLQALLDLYENRTDPTGPTGQCLELARRRLRRLQQQCEVRVAEQLPLIESRLDRAEQLDTTDPKAAQAIRRAVVELFADKPWAAEAVARAQRGLDEKAPSVGPRPPAP